MRSYLLLGGGEAVPDYVELGPSDMAYKRWMLPQIVVRKHIPEEMGEYNNIAILIARMVILTSH